MEDNPVTYNLRTMPMTLILISLTDILMHWIGYCLLLSKYGVPLDFVSSSFTLGSPVQYSFSWELWATLLKPGVKIKHAKRGTQVTGVLAIITTSLSVASLPLSAIEMVPRNGWWQVQTPRGKSSSSMNDQLRRLQPITDNPPTLELPSSIRQITNTSVSSAVPDSCLTCYGCS
jgi:hypothetical protein